MRRFLTVFAIMMLLGSMAYAQTEVLFWDTSGSEARREAVEKIVKDFNSMQNEIKVKRVLVASSETDDTKLQTAVMAGIGPDAYILDRFTVAQRAAAGMLEDLTTLVEKEAGSVETMGSRFVKFAWDEVLFKGHVYAFPNETDIRYMYYNKDLIKKAGIDLAEFDWKNGPLSLDRVKEISDIITKKDSHGAYSNMGFIPWYSQGWHYTWAFAHGGQFIDQKTGLVTLTNPGVVKGIQFMYDWAKAYDPKKVASFLSTYSPPQNPEANHPFLQERLAMFVSGPWEHPKMHKYAKFNWDITYIPTPDKSKTSWSGGNSLVIPKGAKHIDAAYKFIRYMTGPEGSRTFVKIAARFPTLKSLQSEKLPYKEAAFMRDVLAYSNSRPALPVGALLWNELGTVQSNIILNMANPADALKIAENTVNRKLKRMLK